MYQRPYTVQMIFTSAESTLLRNASLGALRGTEPHYHHSLDGAQLAIDHARLRVLRRCEELQGLEGWTLTNEELVRVCNCPPVGLRVEGTSELVARWCERPRWCPWCWARTHLRPFYRDLAHSWLLETNKDLRLEWGKLSYRTIERGQLSLYAASRIAGHSLRAESARFSYLVKEHMVRGACLLGVLEPCLDGPRFIGKELNTDAQPYWRIHVGWAALVEKRAFTMGELSCRRLPSRPAAPERVMRLTLRNIAWAVERVARYPTGLLDCPPDGLFQLLGLRHAPLLYRRVGCCDRPRITALRRTRPRVRPLR